MIVRQFIDIFIWQNYTKECAELLNSKSMHVEDAVQYLIDLLEKNYEFPSKSSESQGS